MHHFNLERLSIDLSNRCSKACDFCYNRSMPCGKIEWQTAEVIDLVKDCAANGLKAVSLGGGEPFEYDGIFEIVSALTPVLFVSVTTNGLPLRNNDIMNNLLKNKPDKIHFSIHNPDETEEIKQTLHFVHFLRKHDIRTGINLLVSADKIQKTKILADYLFQMGIGRDEIIFIPRKFSEQPTVQQLSEVAGGKPFQSTSCLIGCRPSERFCSLSWDKKANFCSYSPSKAPLIEISYNGIINALNSITFKNCTV
jgi:organic radical activating enzyme